MTTLVLTKRVTRMTDRWDAVRTGPVNAAVMLMRWLVVAVVESRK